MKLCLRNGGPRRGASLHAPTTAGETDEYKGEKMKHKCRALIGASMLALVGPDALSQTSPSDNPAAADDARTADVGGPEEVLVTGTRIVMTDGATSPTPLTVVSA